MLERSLVSAADSDFRPEVRRLLPLIIGVRFATNVATRMTYTFLPAFARGSGLSVEAMGTALSIRELTALSAPLSGKFSDRVGPLAMMAYGGMVVGCGLLLATLSAPGLVIGMIVFGFGRTAHQVALGAWVGDAVAYERRGRFTGLIELTWGGASLIGLPFVGFLLGWLPWWSAFLMCGLAAFLLGIGLSRSEQSRTGHVSVTTRKPKMTRTAVAAIVTNGAMNAAAQFLFLGHGLWLEDTYGLDTAEIGLAIIAVGAVEVIATLGSSRLTDRLGKRRSMLGGTLIMTAAMATLSVFPSPPLSIALLLLVIAFLGFEYGIVSAIPLLSELDPGARAQMIGRSVSVGTVVKAVVTLVASAIYVSQGFAVLMMWATAAGVFASVLAAFVMVDPIADRPASRSIRR